METTPMINSQTKSKKFKQMTLPFWHRPDLKYKFVDIN